MKLKEKELVKKLSIVIKEYEKASNKKIKAIKMDRGEKTASALALWDFTFFQTKKE